MFWNVGRPYSRLSICFGCGDIALFELDWLGHFSLLPAGAQNRARAAKGGKMSPICKKSSGSIKILHDLKRQVLRSQLLTRSGCGEMTFWSSPDRARFAYEPLKAEALYRERSPYYRIVRVSRTSRQRRKPYIGSDLPNTGSCAFRAQAGKGGVLT